MTENTMTQIREYLNDPNKPVSMAEFSEFWKTCTDEEKAEFKAADLSK